MTLTIKNLSPASSQDILPHTPVSFDVTDTEREFNALQITVDQGLGREVVHDGTYFIFPYQTSSREVVTDGFSFVVKRSGGWISSPTFYLNAAPQGPPGEPGDGAPYKASIVTNDSAPHTLLSIPIPVNSSALAEISLLLFDDGGNTGFLIGHTIAIRDVGTVSLIHYGHTDLTNDIPGVTLVQVTDIVSGGASSLDFAVNSGGANVRWAITVRLIKADVPPAAP